MSIYHPSEDNATGIAHRLVDGKWQFWNREEGAWIWDNCEAELYGPIKRFNDPVVSFDDTWCEPFEGMEETEDVPPVTQTFVESAPDLTK